MFALGAPPQSCCLGHFSPGHSSALFSLRTRTWQSTERVFNPPAFPHCTLFTSHFWQRKWSQSLSAKCRTGEMGGSTNGSGMWHSIKPFPSTVNKHCYRWDSWENPVLSKGTLPSSRELQSCFRPPHSIATPQYPPGFTWQIHSHSF